VQKQKETKDLSSTSHQQEMSSHLPGRRASVYIAIAPEDNCHNNKCPHSSSFLLASVAEQMSYGTEHAFGQFGSAVLAMSSTKVFPTLSLLVRGGMLKRQP